VGEAICQWAGGVAFLQRPLHLTLAGWAAFVLAVWRAAYTKKLTEPSNNTTNSMADLFIIITVAFWKGDEYKRKKLQIINIYVKTCLITLP
jgi:hypothetical protein